MSKKVLKSVLITGASSGIGATYAERFARGFDRKEAVTIPPLPEIGQWDDFAHARMAMLPNFRQEHPAARYRQ